MGSKNHYEGIDEYAARLIKYKARKLVGEFGFAESDREDLEQELMLDLLRRLPKYDESRAQRNTFIARIVEHKIASIIEDRTAQKRDHRRCSCSLEDTLKDEDGHPMQLSEIIDQDDYLLCIGKLSRRMVELLDSHTDVHRAMEKLPPKLQNLCERLMYQTVGEVSQDTGIARATIYDWMKKVAVFFEEAGLKEYI